MCGRLGGLISSSVWMKRNLQPVVAAGCLLRSKGKLSHSSGDVFFSHFSFCVSSLLLRVDQLTAGCIRRQSETNSSGEIQGRSTGETRCHKNDWFLNEVLNGGRLFPLEGGKQFLKDCYWWNSQRKWWNHLLSFQVCLSLSADQSADQCWWIVKQHRMWWEGRRSEAHRKKRCVMKPYKVKLARPE